MKLKYLILDDDHERHWAFIARMKECGIAAHHGETIWRTMDAAPCIAALREHEFDFVLLDHDLDRRHSVPAEEKNTGSEVARFLANNPDIRARHGKVIVHSFNGPAAMAMVAMIPNSEYIPGLWTREVWEATFGDPAPEPTK